MTCGAIRGQSVVCCMHTLQLSKVFARHRAEHKGCTHQRMQAPHIVTTGCPASDKCLQPPISQYGQQDLALLKLRSCACAQAQVHQICNKRLQDNTAAWSKGRQDIGPGKLMGSEALLTQHVRLSTCATAGSMSSISRIEVALSSRPSRRRPAYASRVALTTPSLNFLSRDCTLPLKFSTCAWADELVCMRSSNQCVIRSAHAS